MNLKNGDLFIEQHANKQKSTRKQWLHLNKLVNNQ